MQRAKRAEPTEAATTTPTFIDINRLYTLPGLCRALGVEQRVIREARVNGLRAKLFGERRLVFRGADVDLWVKTLAPDAPVPKGKNRIEEDEPEEAPVARKRTTK